MDINELTEAEAKEILSNIKERVEMCEDARDLVLDLMGLFETPVIKKD